MPSGTRLEFFAITPQFERRNMIIEPRILALLGKQARSFEKGYKKVSGKFKNHTVSYNKNVGFGSPPTGGDARHYAATTTQSDIMFFLDQGTRVRWRRMSHNWQSKTVPYGGLTTRPGRGRALGFSTTPLPGIAPREFTADLVKKERDNFYAELQTLFSAHSQNVVRSSRIVRP